MIRTLQNAGPTVKIVLGALLVLICASMAIPLIPGGPWSGKNFHAEERRSAC